MRRRKRKKLGYSADFFKKSFDGTKVSRDGFVSIANRVMSVDGENISDALADIYGGNYDGLQSIIGLLVAGDVNIATIINDNENIIDGNSFAKVMVAALNTVAAQVLGTFSGDTPLSDYENLKIFCQRCSDQYNLVLPVTGLIKGKENERIAKLLESDPLSDAQAREIICNVNDWPDRLVDLPVSPKQSNKLYSEQRQLAPKRPCR